MEVHGEGQVPAAIRSGKQPQFYRSLYGPLVLVLTGVKKKKFLACIGVQTQSCQPVENRYTEHVIPGPP
jgi:hypothetical protein